MKVSLKKFCLWVLVWNLFLVVLIVFANGMNLSLELEAVSLETRKTFIAILYNNSYNFLTYVILFPISILLLLFDMLTIGVSVAIGMKVYGVAEVINFLFPHTLLEYPNILLYSFLSFSMLKSVLRSPALKTVKQFLADNYRYYVLSYITLVISSLIEGGSF